MNRDIKDLTRYTEMACIDHRLLKQVDSAELKESLTKCPAKLTESFEADAAKGWWVPISFYNKKNGNGRIYNKQLWENVINNQRDTWVGAPMLADHPEGDSDGSPKDICGIWLDAKMDKPDRYGIGLVYGLLIPSGHIGEDLKAHLANGLKVGTSSSGFGKLMDDGCTVDPNSYVIERLSDWVLNPSQGTFFSYDADEDDIADNSRYGERMEKSNTNNIYNEAEQKPAKEIIMKDSKVSRLEEKKFRRDMESFLESADNIRDPQAKLEEFKEIRSFLEDGACPDLKEKVEQKIATQEAFIKTALMEKLEMQEELNIESPKDLKEKLTKIAEDAAVLDKDAKEWKKIAETLQEKYNATKAELDSRHTNTYVEYQEKKINELQNKLSENDKNAKLMVADLYESYDKMKAQYTEAINKNTEEFKEAKANMEKELNGLKESLSKESKLKEALEKATLDLSDKLTESRNKNTEDAKTLKENADALAEAADLKGKLLMEEAQKETLEAVNADLKEKLAKLYKMVTSYREQLESYHIGK